MGSGPDDAGLELLRAAARQRLAAGQGELDPGTGCHFGGRPAAGRRVPDGLLLDALPRACDVLGFGLGRGGDEAFRYPVLARIIESASKLDSLRVLEEAGTTVTWRRALLVTNLTVSMEPSLERCDTCRPTVVLGSIYS